VLSRCNESLLVQQKRPADRMLREQWVSQATRGLRIHFWQHTAITIEFAAQPTSESNPTDRPCPDTVAAPIGNPRGYGKSPRACTFRSFHAYARREHCTTRLIPQAQSTKLPPAGPFRSHNNNPRSSNQERTLEERNCAQWASFGHVGSWYSDCSRQRIVDLTVPIIFLQRWWRQRFLHRNDRNSTPLL
jgi:hypothetical protein